jgi:hypothetical protein
MNSNMAQKYIHYFGNESSESILEAYGIVTKNNTSIDRLNPRICPNCSEGNTQDAKFCTKCKMIMSYEGYQEALESEKKKEGELEAMKEQFNAMQNQMQSLISAFSSMKDQTQVDSMAKTLYGSGLIKEASVNSNSNSSSSDAVATTSRKEEEITSPIQKTPPTVTQTTTDLEQQDKQREEQLLINEAGKAAYHATITKSALSTTISTATPNKRRKMKIRIKSNLPKKVS